MGNLDQRWRNGDAINVRAVITHQEAITPNDTTELNLDGIKATGGGTVVIKTGLDTDAFPHTLAAGETLVGFDIRVVMAASTATGLIGLRY